jgi:3-oxoacyl-[acyl-carrier protein] reductase
MASGGGPGSRIMVLTGAGSGIGRHLASRLLDAGHRLVLTDVDEPKLQAAARELGWPADRAVLRGQDVRDARAWPEVVDLAVRTGGRLDVLLNVAGVLRPSSVHDHDPADVDLHFDVNAKGVVHGTRAAAARMVEQGHGHVVNVASLAAHCPVPGLALYAASKFAVRGFSLAAAVELRPRGVFVSIVCPDAVQTPMLDRQVSHPEAALSFSGGRALTVQEVANVIVDRVLETKPLEVLIPRSRGVLAQATSVWPGLALRLAPLMLRRGRERQQALLRNRS